MTVLRVELDDAGILELTLNEPKKKNALTDDLRAALLEHLIDAQAKPQVKAIVLSGAEGSFSSGGDISQMTGDPEIARRRMTILHDAVRLIMAGTKPVVAAVSGSAFGAGFSLAMCCDQVIADRTVRFSASFGRVGLPPDLALSFTLPRRVGDAWARRILLSARVIEAGEAKDLGIIDSLVEPADLAATAHRMALELAGFTQEAKGHVKSLVTAASGDLDAVLAKEMDAYITLLNSDEHRAAREAFLAKSKRP